MKTLITTLHGDETIQNHIYAPDLELTDITDFKTSVAINAIHLSTRAACLGVGVEFYLAKFSGNGIKVKTLQDVFLSHLYGHGVLENIGTPGVVVPCSQSQSTILTFPVHAPYVLNPGENIALYVRYFEYTLAVSPIQDVSASIFWTPQI